MLTTVITFIVLLSVLIFVHEFGHFIAARRSGMAVEEFGFGFPPKLWGIKKGKTLYTINWIPLGGFVRIKGESGENADQPDSFATQSLPKRVLVVSAGVIMNVVFAWFLLSVGYTVGLPQIIEGEDGYRQVADAQVHVYDVLPESPAEVAGLEPGDTIISMDGRAFGTISEVVSYTSLHQGESIELGYERVSGEQGTLSVTPEVIEEIERPGIGASLYETGLVSYPWYVAPVEGAKSTFTFLFEIIKALGGFFRDLIVTQKVSSDLSGPVGIAVLTGEVASLGFRYLLQFAALLSLNLAVVNFLPFPALDGGRMVFLIAEAVRRGKAVSRKVEGVTHSLGFAFLMLVVVAVTYRDLVRYGDRILSTLSALVGMN